MSFDYSIKIRPMPVERIEHLEDLGKAHFPREWRDEVKEEVLDSPLQEQLKGEGGRTGGE